MKYDSGFPPSKHCLQNMNTSYTPVCFYFERYCIWIIVAGKTVTTSLCSYILNVYNSFYREVSDNKWQLIRFLTFKLCDSRHKCMYYPGAHRINVHNNFDSLTVTDNDVNNKSLTAVLMKRYHWKPEKFSQNDRVKIL